MTGYIVKNFNEVHEIQMFLIGTHNLFYMFENINIKIVTTNDKFTNEKRVFDSNWGKKVLHHYIPIFSCHG